MNYPSRHNHKEVILWKERERNNNGGSVAAVLIVAMIIATTISVAAYVAVKDDTFEITISADEYFSESDMETIVAKLNDWHGNWTYADAQTTECRLIGSNLNKDLLFWDFDAIIESITWCDVVVKIGGIYVAPTTEIIPLDTKLQAAPEICIFSD